MVIGGHEWWTDEKVETTVTKHFIYSHLRADDAERLTDAVFADLSDNTYLEFILEKARRLFLILIHLGIPGDILRLIEDSYDDDNLPIDQDDVGSLKLSRIRGQQIDIQFYRCQFKYLVRVIGEGEHIRYAEDERVPLQRLEQTKIVSQNTLDKVKLPSPINQVFLLKRMSLSDEKSEYDILSEIAGAKSLSHEHVLSIFGSFAQDEQVSLLLFPATKYDLGQFLNDRPKTFEALPKPERRSHFVLWSHCLANALAWLHEQGVHHGAVRPSRVHVDEQHQISLGQFEGDWALGSPTPNGDLESYQYAAPELWRRGLSVQNQGTTSSFGGRSAVGRRDASRYLAGPRRSEENDDSHMRAFGLSGEAAYTFVPTFKGVSSRLRLEIANDVDSPTSPQLGRSDSHRHDRVDSAMGLVRRHPNLYHRYGPNSVKSSSSSENRKSVAQSERMYSIPSETKHTAVQTWRSMASNLPATDVFGLAAVTMDMLTVLCSRSVSNFAKHRASKNRQAGRGGGLADSSFHANLPQVGTWAESLHKEAEKKLKKNSGEIYGVVGPMLQIIMQCLDREPQKRASASSLARRLERHLTDLKSIGRLHCSMNKPDQIVRTPLLSTTRPSIVELPLRKQSNAGRRPSDRIEGSLESRPEDQASTSKASGSSSGPYTPSDSYVSTASHQRVLSTNGMRSREFQSDPYLLVDDDLQKADSYYVQVMPKDRTMVTRLHKDFTEQESLSRGSSGVAPSFITARTGHPQENSHSSHKNTEYSGRKNHVSFLQYPPATPPPNRQLPASPTSKIWLRTGPSTRSSTAPLDNVQEANDLLAGTLRDMSLEDRLSYMSAKSAYLHLNDDEQEDDWTFAK